MARPASEQTALWVLRKLREGGYEALFAGGCVRDQLLGAPCTDYDVATNASPKQVRGLFRHVLMVGAKFGVAMVVHRGQVVEVVTFRSDETYSDGRRPDRVTFSTAREDALRRDFTINGMFYDPIAKKVIDYVDGQEDLQARILRTIGSPEQRFDEDYLRLIRAVRFAARLDFRIDPATEAALAANADKIVSISGERVFDELRKMLSNTSAVRSLADLQRFGLMQHIVPELFDADDHWPAAMQRAEKIGHYADFLLTLAALLLELPSRVIGRICRRWGASNETRLALQWIAKHGGDWQAAPNWPLCKIKRLLAYGQFDRLCLLWLAIEELDTGQTDYHQLLRKKIASIDPDQIAPPPLVSGEDLLGLGLSESPKLGRILNKLYDAQLNEELKSRRTALAEARRMVTEAAAPNA
ncbi:hypothetical protein LCGC14_0162780 [marine sediment metagenome]|uniref:Poly A polymerase head domain-containing protein n=1 Tax=marine sediment metagenome TaxID=412755 RepID=A0A0F9VB72_9ZZZZ